MSDEKTAIDLQNCRVTVSVFGNHQLRDAVVSRLRGWGYSDSYIKEISDGSSVDFFPGKASATKFHRITIDEFMKGEFLPKWRRGGALKTGDRIKTSSGVFVVAKPLYTNLHNGLMNNPRFAISEALEEVIVIKQDDTYEMFSPPSTSD